MGSQPGNGIENTLTVSEFSVLLVIKSTIKIGPIFDYNSKLGDETTEKVQGQKTMLTITETRTR